MYRGNRKNRVKPNGDSLKMGAVMDGFGSDVVAMKEDNTHFRISVSVAVSQQFFAWVFGLGKAVRIVAPESVKEQMKKALKTSQRDTNNRFADPFRLVCFSIKERTAPSK